MTNLQQPAVYRARCAPGALVRAISLFVLCLAVTACGNHPSAPVEDRYGRAAPSSSSVYYVQRGETLYSIAFRYGLDYRRLAAANGIAEPFTIFPGQRLKLSEATAAVAAVKPAKSTAAGKPAAAKPAVKPAAQTRAATPGTAARSPVSPPPKPAVTPTPRAAPKPGPAAKPAPVPAAPSAGQWSGQRVGAWRWPAQGKVTRGYSSSVHKGIDIGGQRGDPVVAVADGQVVYAGTGIVGFGELLIIKHNDIYLSAYGHNDRLLVAEGQLVRAGQRIAEKGSSGTDYVKLHFEIRKEGKPVDPQRLLPRR